ncbi:MAG: HprK-related kinase B [Mariprofundus sp.]|nr:HprK-related kinase B [Mariprofundus sp.]
MASLTVDSVRNMIMGDAVLNEELLQLALPELNIRVQSNSTALLATLSHYFRHIVHTEKFPEHSPTIEVIAIESPAIDAELPLKDWSREAGKRGKKDAYLDIDGGRCIYKVRTGMMFLQSLKHRIAAGPCLDNSNQVINFINNQYMNLLQQQGWLICHAAALAQNNQAIAIAGFSGGGKSTAMLHLMSDQRFDFVSNDRLFIHAEATRVQARGIPKLPRVNPGTLLHNPQLLEILPADQIDQLKAMPKAELWELEEKYDVDIADIYGHSRFSMAPSSLGHFLILNWSHHTQQPTAIREIDVHQRPELLDAIMKSSGPFYQHLDGSFNSDDRILDRQHYIDTLTHLHVYEVSGKVDFSVIQAFCSRHPAIPAAI